jgi:hypothetical protein
MSSERKTAPGIRLDVVRDRECRPLCSAYEPLECRHAGAVVTVFFPCDLATLSPQQHTNERLTET